MAEETITILKVGTEDAVKSIGDLKDNIRVLKNTLEDLEVGTDEYRNTLDELKVNQNALKDAMYATTASMEDVAQAATGASESYNSLVHRIAALKEEFRATNDEARRSELGAQIKEVNDRLKEMDALQGNFQRNVGNYTESIKDAFKGLGEKTDSLGKGMKVAQGGIEGIKGGFEAFGKSPGIATFGIIVGVVAKLADNIKQNDEAMASINQAAISLKPIMDFFANILNKVVKVVSDLVVKALDFVGSSGILEKAKTLLMGVGNVIVQYVITPFKAVAEAIKVFKEKGLKGFKEAGEAFAGAYKEGFSFKKNFENGKQVGIDFASGVKAAAPEAKEAGESLGNAVKEGVENQLAKIDWNKMNQTDKAVEAEIERKKDEEEQLKDIEEFGENLVDEVDAYLEERDAAEKKSYEAHKALEQMRVDDIYTSADMTSSLLSSIADMYEADEESSEKNAKKIKALRIASAIIDTLSGAVKALSASAENPVMAIANAATITAAGMANVLKIKNTEVSSSSDSSSSVSSATTLASAPAVTTEVSQVRSVTSASEETRLNQMASEQRVYILADDIQASQSAIKTQIQQTSF